VTVVGRGIDHLGVGVTVEGAFRLVEQPLSVICCVERVTVTCYTKGIVNTAPGIYR